MEFDLGTRLKEVRLAANMSQRELAKRAGVPHGLISIIEQNKSSPSVATLRKVLSGVPMNLSEFFQEEVSNAGKIFFKKSELIDLTERMPNHARHRSARIEIMQVGDAQGANLQLLYERYQPKADTGATMFQHEAHEGGIVLKGTLELTVGDQVGILNPGDSYLFDSRTPHRFRNVGEGVLEFIAACTPPFL